MSILGRVKIAVNVEERFLIKEKSKEEYYESSSGRWERSGRRDVRHTHWAGQTELCISRVVQVMLVKR